jgi:ABC-type transport system involved in cytochrome c biogenesis permease subunit
MGWDFLYIYAIVAVLLMAAGALVAFRGRRRAAIFLSAMGSAVLMTFVVGLWMVLERPPLRTMGETRLWYSLFLSVAGVAVYVRWRYRWILSFTTLLSTVFLCVNLFNPEIHSKSLMPALQSVWFVPHVVVYMMAYALLGAVTLFAVYLWLRRDEPQRSEVAMCDNLVSVGWSFLSAGMVMGALWAKQAWGDYWSWDPKETWAAATWLAYLLYMHLRRAEPKQIDVAFGILCFAFLLLQMCWWGINFLPSAQGGMHSY